MKTIIAGSRTITNYAKLLQAIDELPWVITLVISGGAKGVDRLGETYAKENDLPLEIYPANWDKFGRKAGPIRNSEMADNAEALLALWDGESRGTKHMIQTANYKGLKVKRCLIK